MADESDVQISSNKRLLKELREEEDGNTRFGNGHAESRNSLDRPDEGTTEGDTSRIREGEGAAAEIDSATKRFRERVRPTNGQTEHTTESAHTGSRRPEIKFQLRNPFNYKDVTQPPVKLFSKAEAKEELERLQEVYYRGSGILDDILEIVVRGHESVQIWQLDETEANMLAEMHLNRAQVDVQAARSARQMLAIYDRLYVWLLTVPRLRLTAIHIKQQGGLSFK
jgi:hypothetical protein